MFDRVCWCFLWLALFITFPVQAQKSEPIAVGQPGAITLDVVVTPKSGPPVNGLRQQDFTILDNKAPQAITSFQAFQEREAAIEVIVVVDDVNTGLEHIAYEKSEINKFLKIDGGHLAHPTALAFLTDSGLSVQEGFTTDGNALSAFLDQNKMGLHSVLRTGGIYSADERFELSLKALYQLVTRESARPGRKFIVWISPGWPILSGPGVESQLDDKQRKEIFSEVVELSTMLRNGRITLYSIDPLGSADFAGRAFRWEAFVKGVSKPYQADPGDLALQVLAVQSGGKALTTGNDLAAFLQECIADTRAYYELSFVPTLDTKQDPYHRVEVRVAKAGLIARTRQGYYAEQ
jgi:VWFA-related protein